MIFEKHVLPFNKTAGDEDTKTKTKQKKNI